MVFVLTSKLDVYIVQSAFTLQVCFRDGLPKINVKAVNQRRNQTESEKAVKWIYILLIYSLEYKINQVLCKRLNPDFIQGMNVGFKPSKKMKKRRELDALVNGKLGRKKPKKGDHELLRNDSESSDIEEFSIPHKSVIRKKTAGRICAMCSTCVTLCAFVMLTGCVVGIIGLTWIHIELKKDVDSLRGKIQKVESSNELRPEERKAMNDDIKRLKDQTAKLQSICDKQNKTISTLSAQIVKLNASIKTLDKSIASAPELAGLPATVKNLQQEVATLGSGLSTVQADFTEDKDNMHSRMEHVEELLKATPGRKGVTPEDGTDGLSILRQTMDYLHKNVTLLTNKLMTLNNSMDDHFAVVGTHMSVLTAHLSELTNKTQALAVRLAMLELGQNSHEPNSNGDTQQNLRELVLNIINNTTLPGSSPDLTVITAEIENMTQAVGQLQDKFKMFQEKLDQRGTTTVETGNTGDLAGLLGKIDTMQQNQITRFQVVDESIGLLNKTVRVVGEELTSQGEHLSVLQQQVTALSAATAAPVQRQETSAEQHVTGTSEETSSEEPEAQGDEHTTSLPLKIMSVPFISNREDVKNNFYKWDMNDSDGKVTYDRIRDFLGPNIIPYDDLKLYDKNQDGQFSVDEMIAAFGYTTVTTPNPGASP